VDDANFDKLRPPAPARRAEINQILDIEGRLCVTWSYAHMAIFAILCFLLGAVLGQRFKVLVLGPSIAFGVVVAIAVGIGRAEDVWGIVLTVILVSASIEIGYLSGTIINSLIIAEQTTQIIERPSEFKQVESR
jgi:hypothetical protein